ncbi:hypothetical protein V0R50_10390 [Pseudomonas sp. 148P]|uniref:Uncharacterized protein n=1 Tax=Pseudomonas ulcerans TaxID=3115852 RepID=A0ABU7HQ48_9PSED|nr:MULTISPECIES: hypothetical protein [unclassified Pseudomonas]MEE1922652.1 hypothetical protein [Pseudomonas sp. 147P]MEE1933629.1 hypothetical protein [Pseudomonas sp. 148P]
MSARKPHSMKARMDRACRALVATNHVAVVNIDPSGRQMLMNWKSCKQIRSRQIVDAVCDIAHRWTIYISVMCQKPDGEQYYKSEELATDGNYLASHLTDVIEASYTDLFRKANPNHRIASGWIAIPTNTTLDEPQAAKVFVAAGAWTQQKAA